MHVGLNKAQTQARRRGNSSITAFSYDDLQFHSALNDEEGAFLLDGNGSAKGPYTVCTHTHTHGDKCAVIYLKVTHSYAFNVKLMDPCLHMAWLSRRSTNLML